MKKIYFFYSFNLLALVFISSITFAQVGINTTNPKGVIDFNSSTLGVVYPNVALLGTDDATTVINPQGGPIVEGTVVYNTNTTNNGLITDIYPGIYVWNGSEWVVHYKKRHSELFTQNAMLRTESNFAGGFQDIPGLGISNAKTFRAKYSGLYRIEVKTNFAGGRTQSNSSIFVSQAKGQFRFLFGVTPYLFESTAFSAYSNYVNSGKYYEGIWKESYETNYVTLTAGTIYPFSLTFDAYNAEGFLGNGSPYIGPSSIDLINEDFDPNGSYTVIQSNTPDGDCSTNGWAISSANPCNSCSGYQLYINSRNVGCTQNATARMSFTPSLTTISIKFDYLFREESGKNDRFRVYLHNGTTQVGTDLVNINNSGSITTDSSFSGVRTVVAGTAHTLRFEYINGTSRGRYASVDNIVISENSGPIGTLYDGCGYIGNEVDCQIEFTYIGE